jgi:radical SAM superfamily enzyme YgiQ (UPF0313 family)
MSRRKRFYILLVKPTRYDDDGYPVHWLRSAMPSNSLACLYGIALDCRDRKILGEDVEIVVEAFDENNYLLDTEHHIRKMNEGGDRGMLALVGVQSNQFPRAIDIAQPFLKQGVPVCMGGYHVSGCLAMFPEPTPELAHAMDSGISLFAGEAEERRFDRVVLDASKRNLQRLYDYSNDLPDLSDQPLPYMEPEHVQRCLSNVSSIDLGRGCPFNCSFCCIINVQGRKSRFRSAEGLEKTVRFNSEIGTRSMFITDDNFARNKNWEVFLDKLIALKEEGIKMSYVIQVDTLCHRIPGFIDKCVAAGVDQVFIGLENINPDNLAAMNKKQNRITEYREMLLAWKRHPVIIWGAYIVGFPNDTRESILHDVELIKRELPIDLLNISILTPLPGSEDHKKLHDAGTWMDPDLNNYDLAHRVTHHPKMTDAELDKVYEDAWDTYYTFDHMSIVLRRMFAMGSNKRLKTVERLTAFGVVTRQHGMRSYDMGIVRLKSRKSRRAGLTLENPIVFYSKYFLQTVKAGSVIIYSYWRLRWKMLQIEKDPNRMSYKDTAIAPSENDDMDKLALFNETRGGQEVVIKYRQRQKRPGASYSAP